MYLPRRDSTQAELENGASDLFSRYTRRHPLI